MKKRQLKGDWLVADSDLSIDMLAPGTLTFDWIGDNVKINNISGGDVVIEDAGSYGSGDLPYTLPDGTSIEFYFDYGYHLLKPDNEVSKKMENISLTNIERKYDYPVMSDPPTITVGVGNAASVLTTPQEVSAVDADNGALPNTTDMLPSRGDYYGDYGFLRAQTITKANYAGSIWEEIILTDESFEIKIRGYANGYRILVDEGQGYQYVTKDFIDDIPDTSLTYRVLVDFGSFATRKIMVQMKDARFSGFTTNGNGTIRKPSPTSAKNHIFATDSFGEGLTSFGMLLGQYLGDIAWNSGAGGTGYTNKGTNDVANMKDRNADDIVAYQPQRVSYCLGLNDLKSTPSELAEIKSNALYCFNETLTGVPDVEIFVVGNMFPHDPQQIDYDCNEVLQEAALEAGLPYIDTLNGIAYNSSGVPLNIAKGQFFTGSGNVGSPQSTGNASKLIKSDNTHPTDDEGQPALAEWLYQFYELIEIDKVS